MMEVKVVTIPNELVAAMEALVRKKGIVIVVENEAELDRMGVDKEKVQRVLEQWLLAELSAQVLRIDEDDLDE